MTTYTTNPANPIEALEAVEALTIECARIMRAIENAPNGRTARLHIARMREVNEVRLRIIEAWRLQTEALAMVGRVVR